MKEYFIIKLQSFIDVITNSSSELFLCETKKSAEVVDEMLRAYGVYGYDKPWIFDWEHARKNYIENGQSFGSSSPYGARLKNLNYNDRKNEITKIYEELLLIGSSISKNLPPLNIS